ncbi:MAG: ATP-binding cassette domain-containing protein [Erysipelotrichales bacterium]|nr:ATP-binding cassette domain-containing protein [Erysipelotrichales bacterium]
MAIEFKNLSYVYRGVSRNDFEQALDSINLKIEATGEFIILCGKTGSGKSTLIQQMNALLTPTSGESKIFDKVIHPKKNKDLNKIRKHVGMVFQFPEYQFFEETVLKDVSFGPRNFGYSKEEAEKLAKEALKLVGFPEELYGSSPFKLSGGQMRKASIAAVLSLNTDILVLDEPTRGLDPKGRKEIMALFSDIQKKTNKTIVMITHDMDLLYQYANRVLVMKAGKLVFDGSKNDLFKAGLYQDFALEKPEIVKIIDLINEIFSMRLSYNTNPESFITLLESEVRRNG